MTTFQNAEGREYIGSTEVVTQSSPATTRVLLRSIGEGIGWGCLLGAVWPTLMVWMLTAGVPSSGAGRGDPTLGSGAGILILQAVVLPIVFVPVGLVMGLLVGLVAGLTLSSALRRGARGQRLRWVGVWGVVVPAVTLLSLLCGWAMWIAYPDDLSATPLVLALAFCLAVLGSAAIAGAIAYWRTPRLVASALH